MADGGWVFEAATQLCHVAPSEHSLLGIGSMSYYVLRTTIGCSFAQADFVAYKGYQGLLEEDRAYDGNGALGCRELQ